MRKILLALTVITLQIVCQSCSKDDAELLIGTWQRTTSTFSYIVTLTDQGTFTVDGPVTTQGNYWTSDDQLTFIEPYCISTGKYKYDIDGETLTFSLISDSCDVRHEVIVGEWKKK
jgi:hypothetical protein